MSMPLLPVANGYQTWLAGSNAYQSTYWPTSRQFGVNERGGPNAGVLAGIVIPTDSSALWLGIFLLQEEQYENLLISNDWYSPWLYKFAGLSQDDLSARLVRRVTTVDEDGFPAGIPKPMAAVRGGDIVFGEWFEALGLSLGNALLEYGARSMLTDNYSWHITVAQTWALTSRYIRVATPEAD